MKYLYFTLTLLIICLIALSCVIYFKPMPNRYHFVTNEYRSSEGVVLGGHTVQDTATGKIYEWTTTVLIRDGEPKFLEALFIKDPVRNKVISKIPAKSIPQIPKWQKRKDKTE